jgi:hypothetical protein
MGDERKKCVMPGCDNLRRSPAPQTKYCEKCAREQKRLNSEEGRTYDMRKEELRAYMREYRKKHPGLSTQYVRRHRQKHSSEPTPPPASCPAKLTIIYASQKSTIASAALRLSPPTDYTPKE